MEELKLILGLIASIAATLTAVITLVYELVKYVRKAAQERNWPRIVKMVSDLMAEAEGKLAEGADRKAWVLAMVKAMADEIKYDVDLNAVGELIDSLCKMASVVNTTVTVHDAEEVAGAE